MSGAIFISYRRDDSEGEAGRLYDDLFRVFGSNSVFMDVSDIHPGRDFRTAIDDNVAKCAVLLAIIGPTWMTAKDPSGGRRIDQANDFVRLEIGSALARGIDVIPVLVHGAKMPNPSELPESLQNLAFRNGVELTHVRWNSDVEVLSRTLREYVMGGDLFQTQVIRSAILGLPAAPAAPAEAPVANPRPANPRYKFMRVAAAFLVLVVAAMLGAFAFTYIHHMLKHHKDQGDAPAVQTSPNP